MNLQLLLLFKAESVSQGEQVKAAILGMLKENGIQVNSTPPVEIAPSEVIVHTDGGCDRNKDGLGAWAYTIQYPDGSYEEDVGAEIGTTNNRMEMMAVLKALSELEIGVPIKVFSDSEYVVKGITVWSRNWVRNGWKTASGNPVINQDLWEQLLQLYQVHDVKFEWVKGHAGHTFNERCDELCTEAMVQAHKQLLSKTPELNPNAVAPL